ncbi:hypothetical protein F7R01_22560 [Pseudomonas argentinensis]|uniref:hypothetical protein n=1 Tax=Phytopseudomonas argentinensis TaxID=289370 RepID=UPI000943606B|nr:hypothetical protein [Pseudomonas argentinensis]KAB0546221.1 hypothetical protein F7R01_22560 [Pseudomonas argentinensis]
MEIILRAAGLLRAHLSRRKLNIIMKTTAFTHEQLAKLTGTNQIESNLRKWLISLSVEERIAFISELWPTNFLLALKLTQAAQLPRKEMEEFFRSLLRKSHHNTAQEIIKRFTPMLGEKKFWRIAAQEEITPTMRDFLNYYGRGRLDLEITDQPQLMSPSDTQK